MVVPIFNPCTQEVGESLWAQGQLLYVMSFRTAWLCRETLTQKSKDDNSDKLDWYTVSFHLALCLDALFGNCLVGKKRVSIGAHDHNQRAF